MSMNTPDEIRANIELTRDELGSDVDALADKVRPSSIAHRQVGKVRGAVSSVKDRVMGAASDVTGSVGDTASSVGNTVKGAPGAAVSKAEGHPVAVGLIAFGVGLLASAMIPSSSKERELAGNIKDSAAPLKDELTDAAKQVASNLREPAQEAMETVKSSATEAVDNVKAEGASAASDVKDTATNGGGTSQYGTTSQY